MLTYVSTSYYKLLSAWKIIAALYKYSAIFRCECLYIKIELHDNIGQTKGP